MKSLREWVRRHPRLTAWVILAAVLAGVVAYDTRALGLGGLRMVLLLTAALGVSAAAVWVVSWDRSAR